MKKIMVFGATSAILSEVSKIYASHKSSFYLVGRNTDKLEDIAKDLLVRGATKAFHQNLDFTAAEQIQTVFSKGVSCLGEIDLIVIGHGSLTDQMRAQYELDYLEVQFQINLISYLNIITLAGNYFEKRGKGQMAIFGSVAGDRGRQSNYVYGCAKGALALFCQGLRNRLSKKDVQVTLLKPGFVDTPMTEHIVKGPLFVSAEYAARCIFRAIEKKKNQAYIPGFWFFIMLIIKLIPEKIFKRLSL